MCIKNQMTDLFGVTVCDVIYILHDASITMLWYLL